MLLSIEHISKDYGTKKLLDDIALYLNEGDKIGIIGINGAGKSTLLKILAGVEEADQGTLTRNHNIRVSYLAQNPNMDDNHTVMEQVFADLPDDFRTLNEYEARTMLTVLGITRFDQKIGTLSGGQRKRVALAAALIHPADLFILDEPTNHLDSEMVTWLEQQLIRFNGGLVMVTHDRYFLERVVNHITELSRGKLYHYEANYSRYLELKAQRTEIEEASERKRQAVLRREYQWIMRGARARGTKSRERIARYEALRDQSGPQHEEGVQMVGISSRLGRKTIALSHISKAFDGITVLDDFSYQFARDDRIGIVGRNGVGKSTLLNIISGAIQADSGTVDMGATVRLGYFTQEGRALDPDQRVYDFIAEIADHFKTKEGTFSASQMLERFLFPADLQCTPMGKLSGGERRRVYLLSILMEAPNILLLDEPTNDLDVETLAILEDYLEDFDGAVVAVSHDRYFLDKMADSIFEIESGGQVNRYVGNYSDYAEKKKAEQTNESVQTKPESVPAPKRKSDPVPKKLKFSFKEQREFETIDDDIAALEQQLAELEQQIEEFACDYVKLSALTEEKEALTLQLEEKTERWVYLNELAEKIEAQRTGS
ncbi:MAG: ABC-F family ATP-binding cassette domain-containing protein [Oscillospiraceae bacterium]|jgi:ATP-binding cassette subfamily F protein uup